MTEVGQQLFDQITAIKLEYAHSTIEEYFGQSSSNTLNSSI